MGCRWRCPWWASRVEGDFGDDEDTLPFALLTDPRDAMFCLGLPLLPLLVLGIATATGVFSLEKELARPDDAGRGGVAMPVLAGGEEDLAGGGVGRREAGDAAAMVSSTCLTSGGIGTLNTMLTAFQSTVEIILYSGCRGGLQQPGQPLLLATGSFCWR